MTRLILENLPDELMEQIQQLARQPGQTHLVNKNVLISINCQKIALALAY